MEPAEAAMGTGNAQRAGRRCIGVSVFRSTGERDGAEEEGSAARNAQQCDRDSRAPLSFKSVQSVLKFRLFFPRRRGHSRASMALKRKVTGGVLAFVGYMLSPLSWWNDAYVNLPLALAFAWIIGLFYKPAFGASLVIGYWLTNVLGFVLMHKGAEKVLSEKNKAYSRRELIRDVGISLLYTALIVALLKLKILKPIENYFTGK
jgi:hypothetical protein